MWFERFVIIVTSLAHEYLPHGWGGIRLTGAGGVHWVDLSIVAGSFGWFFLWFLLFLKTLPWIAITEVREGLHAPARPIAGGAAGEGSR
jgi:hypothetical protein